MKNKEVEAGVDIDTEELEAALALEELERLGTEVDGDDELDSDDELDGDTDAPADTKSTETDTEDGDATTDDKEPDEALEELEAAELEIEDDPATLLIDEAAEIREMRREELGLTGGQEIQSGEFVCSECFLVKAGTQLANKARKVCADCV